MRADAALALWLLATAACGQDVALGAGRSRPDAAAPVDSGAAPADSGAAPVDSGATDDALEFSEPLVIDAIAATDATDDDPSLSADLTLLYFNSERDGGAGQEDIWFSTRGSAGEAWQPAQVVQELNTEDRETGIALAADGLTIWWSSDRPDGEGGLDVYTATRASRDAAWSDALHVQELSSAGDDPISSVTDGARSVLLARRANEDEDYDLFAASRGSPTEPFGEPAPIAELNGDDEESDAFLVAAGTGVLFTRDEDLQLARRARADLPFEPAQELAALNSDADDRDAWATDALDYVVFSSDRSGEYLLYEASR